MTPMSAVRKAVQVSGLPVVLVAVWWFATADSESFYWPPLRTILEVFPETWLEGRLQQDVVPSLVRLAVGFALALLIGVGVGVAIGSSRRLRLTLEPALEFFRALPPPILVPIIILFAGIGDGMKILVIVSGALWPVLLNTIEGVRGVDEVLRDTARVYRLRTATRLRHLILRGASPQIAAGARQGLSIAIILMVISEMFAASNGLGFSIVQFQRRFAIPEMWSGILLLGLIGFVLAVLFRAVESRALSWYVGVRQADRGKG